MKGRALGSVAFALLLGMATPAAHAAAVAGRVVDADGRPVAGALVSCRPVPSAEQRLLEETRAIEAKPIAETKTDEHGLFSIRFQRDPGDLLLRVSARGLPSREMEAEADSDQPGGELEILLPESRRFSGRITDESGRPLPRVRVRVFDSRETGEGVAFGEAVTGAEGRFEVPNAPDGDVAIAARAPGLVPVLIFRSRSMTSETLVLKRGGSVEGTLRDAAGKSLAGVVVVSADAAEETDAAGHYRLDGIAIGLASVRARWKEDQARREGVVVRKGETARVDLRLGPSAVISGTIVDEKTRRPLSGVHVSASSSFAKSGRPEEVARTDARGGFRLGGLSAGSYELRAERRGYLPGGAAAAAGASSATVSLALRKAGTISGRVVDERGVAVAGARIRRLPPIGRSETFEGSSFPLSSVPSYRDGSFRMRGLPPGEASLLAQKEGWVAARRDGVGVRSGDVTKRVVLTLRRGVEAKGRVVDRTGQPIAGAEVRLWSMKNPSATVSAVADPQGSFSARGLTEGAYAAEVSARGFATKTYDALAVGKRGAAWVPFVLGPSAPISGWVRNTAGDAIAGASISSSGGTDGEEVHAQSDAEGRFRLDGWAEGRQVALEIAAEGYARLSRTVNAPTDGLTAILSAAATLRGRVEDAETQKPLESFSLGWHVPRGSYSWFGARAEEFRTPDGVFELPGVGPGRVVLRGAAPGYIDSEMGGLDLQEGEVREGIVLSLKKGLTVTGRVLEPSRGNGVPNAEVRWERAGTGELFSDGRLTTTDAEGRFHFESLPSAPLRFVAAHPDYAEARRIVDPAEEPEVELTLSTGGRIVGSVVTRHGAAVDGAVVSLAQFGGSRLTSAGDERSADPHGLFVFEHLPEGRYQLTARASAGQSAPQTIVLERDQRVEGVRLALQGGARIRGQVRGLPTERLAGLKVQAGAEDFAGEAMTTDAGQFSIENVPPGKVTVFVSTSVYGMGRAARKTFEVPPDTDEVSVEVVFEGDSRLSGRVLRGERGVPGISVSVRSDPPASGTIGGTDVTDSDGVYVTEGLLDGDYRVTARGEGVNASRRVSVSGDTVLDIVVGGTSVSGVVTDEKTGEPIEGTIVQAETGGERSPYGIPSARSDAYGFYEITDLDPGTYRVTARHEGYASKTRSISVDDTPADLNFLLPRSSGVALHAVDGLTGAPLLGVDVLAFSSAGATAFYGAVPLDEEGHGEVPAPAAGAYTLYVYARGYAPRTLAATVPSPPLEVLLTPGGRVEVRAEAPATGQIFDASGALYLSSPGRSDGIVNIDTPLTIWRNFTPGSYRIVIPGASGDESYEFSVSEGKTTALALR